MTCGCRIDYTKAGEFINYCPLHASAEKLLEALRAISLAGGNLPDERWTDKTGPNDAAYRGLIYVQCREIARAAIASASGSAERGAGSTGEGAE